MKAVKVYKPAHFTGNRNQSKALVFILLAELNLEGLGYLSYEEIARYTGITVGVLACLLPKWVEWGYLTRIPSSRPSGLRGNLLLKWEYNLTPKGLAYVQDTVPIKLYDTLIDKMNKRTGK